MKNKIWFLIGASGSGKSTLAKVISEKTGAVIYSWDDLRHRWYDDEDYSMAFQMSCEDPDFYGKAIREFRNLLEQRVDIVIDNINTNPKARKRFTKLLDKDLYTTIGVVFDNPLSVLQERQQLRSDKTVPDHVVKHQYITTVRPDLNELDQVINSTEVIELL